MPFTDVPETKVKLGSSLDPSTIREGTDVYFDCLVTAHPHVYKVEWRHNVSISDFNYYLNGAGDYVMIQPKNDLISGYPDAGMPSNCGVVC